MSVLRWHGTSVGQQISVRSEKDNWAQFIWELGKTEKELAEFLALSDEHKAAAVKQFGYRLEVARARLNLLAATLDQAK